MGKVSFRFAYIQMRTTVIKHFYRPRLCRSKLRFGSNSFNHLAFLERLDTDNYLNRTSRLYRCRTYEVAPPDGDNRSSVALKFVSMRIQF